MTVTGLSGWSVQSPTRVVFSPTAEVNWKIHLSRADGDGLLLSCFFLSQTRPSWTELNRGAWPKSAVKFYVIIIIFFGMCGHGVNANLKVYILYSGLVQKEQRWRRDADANEACFTWYLKHLPNTHHTVTPEKGSLSLWSMSDRRITSQTPFKKTKSISQNSDY